MPDDAEFAAEQPAARIRARIGERRVLEARFLLRQFSEALDAGERQALIREVSRLLAEAERLRHLARTAAAEGRRGEAARLYDDIEQVAVDLPGLAEERAAQAGAAAIFSRMAAQEPVGELPEPAAEPVPVQETKKNEPLPVPERSVPEPTVSAAADRRQSGRELWVRGWDRTRQLLVRLTGLAKAGLLRGRDGLGRWSRAAGKHAAGSLWWLGGRLAACFRAVRTRMAALLQEPRLRRSRGLWLAAGCVGLLLLLALIWQSRTNESPSVAPAAAPARDLATGPAATDVPVASPHFGPEISAPVIPSPQQAPAAALPPAESSPPPAPQAAPPAEQADAPPPTFKLGTLQVEESSRK
ncbi:hypothetical protein [Desulfobulbus elongatus]|uniref:hypothetical protein n=1 Tax=Desulfobulbus elongatus TaxID=53332 RepID=UPI000483A615|nr:hypothetical protein [Desulfobulbus elongatus]